jgi:flavin-dependent dehydrogenase
MGADVLVVGAGPAGLATAIAASLQGLRAIVVDSRHPPIDKTCGEGLLPEAVSALNSLGIQLNSPQAFPLKGIRFSDQESSACASLSGGTAFALRRTALNQLLIERAAQLGVEFLWGARITSFDSRVVNIAHTRHTYRWLVGADGRDSVVRKWAGLHRPTARRVRFGFRKHYSVTPWADLVEVHWGNRFQIFATPTGPEEVCVCLLTSDPRIRIEQALPHFPALAQHLHGAAALTTEHGAVTALEPARAVARGNIALVGDASGTVDGIAGVGLSLAFQQAISLGEALAREDLNYYQAAHRRIARMPARMNRLLLLMNHSAWIRRKALRLFAKSPRMFSALMSLHTGQGGTEQIRARHLLDLGWRVLWA